MGKKRLRDMTWDDYGISKNRYKELKRSVCSMRKRRKRYGTGYHLSKTKDCLGEASREVPQKPRRL